MHELRRYLMIVEAAAYPLLYRWTDAKATLAYLKADAITPRTVHFIPELNKMTRGISTSMFPTRWTSGGPIGFVIDAAKLPNKTYAFNGQAIYTLTQQIDFMKRHNQFGQNDIANYKQYLHAAEHEEPDEMFVAGKITNLSGVLKEIRIKKGEVSPEIVAALQAYGQVHGIAVGENEYHHALESASGLRRHIDLREAEQLNTEGIKPLYADFSTDDLIYFAGNFKTAEEFAERLVDSSSKSASATRQQLIDRWREWDESGASHRKPALQGNLSAIERHVAKAIGATSSTNAKSGLPWDKKMYMGGDGTIFDTPDGHVFLDANVEKTTVYLPQIAVEKTGSGLGTTVMEAIRAFANAHHYGIIVYKVTNPNFFRHFPWLTEIGQGQFQMAAN